MSTADLILTERRDPHLLIITINRYERRNAFDAATATAMESALDEYDDDPELRCAIITGAGGTFSAGQDLTAAARGERAVSPRRGGFGIMAVPPRKPVIAAVEGHALAGGLELCLSCDLIVAARTATMGLPEVTRSLVAIGGALFRLPKRIPYHLAMELALTGTPWPATDMHRLGLVNRLAEPGEALNVAIELASTIAAAGPLAVAASAQIVRNANGWNDADGWEKQMEFAGPVTKSEDFAEGLRAFAEKRAPIWRAR